MTISVDVTCPACGSGKVIRHGFAPHGVQRFRCRGCGRVFVRDVDRRGYTEAFKEQVLAAYQERASMRGIARVFGISRNTLTRWLREKGGASRT
jgi:transposase-like protein